ncbi:hypothetical protein QCA50_012210 [Cerrena zonata]|uniref:Pentatricopeptide repeat-containing protein n=1 Tax=Cerrena zonata TaxID=2478898 RepID=A0AAW0FYW2_9APHY
MVALFGWMDREYLFTSASTLILFNASFGVHDATKEHLDHALTIFTKMKKLGNYPAALRRAQLLKLIRVLDFNGVMNSLLVKHDGEPKETNDVDPRPGLVDMASLGGIGGGLNINGAGSGNSSGAGSFISESIRHPNVKMHTAGDDEMTVPGELDFLNFPTALGGENTNGHMANNPVPNTANLTNLAGIEGMTYIDEEQKLWNEITNDAVWLHVPGGNPNDPVATARHTKSALTLNQRPVSTQQQMNTNALSSGNLMNHANFNFPNTGNILGADGGSSNNSFPNNGGYSDIINLEFQDLMN